MILTDIYVAALDQSFDFHLNEDTPVSTVVDEIVGILAKELMEESGTGQYSLCSYDHEQILPADMTLSDCGIRNGSRLLLV